MARSSLGDFPQRRGVDQLRSRDGEHALGARQVDFFEVYADVNGQRQKAFLFLMRMMATGTDFVSLYDRQDQVSFLDGHARAFEFFGAVPQRIAYDNLKAAVTRVLVGSARELAARFCALASHYLFELCRPRTGHDKGGVESRGKAVRLQHLVPIPQGDSLPSIRDALLARVASRQVGKLHAARSKMQPLPGHRFDARRTLSLGVSQRSLVTDAGTAYSVPCRWAGLDVMAHVGPDAVDLVGPEVESASAADYDVLSSEMSHEPRRHQT